MQSSPRYIVHLIANSHLDPVWLWDWREGLNEALITVRSVLRLMDEFPEVTYVRGETAIYEQIERYDPDSFVRIKEYVEAGRWEYVGGTFVQPDTNLPGTETMCRHFTYGQRYFTSRFGKPAQVAWAADSFGHSIGLPAIFSRAGIRYFAFSRPGKNDLHLDGPAFHWRGADGSKVLTYRLYGGGYGIERDGMAKRLDEGLEIASKYSYHHVPVFYGLGDHGGGPSRRHLRDIRAWSAQHPDVEVLHSGMHRFFRALEEEAAARPGFPEINSELNFFARGCYSSAARFKFKYRRAEAGLGRAECTNSAIAAGLGLAGADLARSWRGLLFNSFHDILPGSSMERATDEQISWVEGLIHANHEIEFDSLNQLARRIHLPALPPAEDDHPQPLNLLVWNPHPYPYRALLELEGSLDYRPLWSYEHRGHDVPIEVRDVDGAVIPFQVIATEHNFMPQLPWRKRVVIDAEIPPLGWTVYSLGWIEGAEVSSLHGTPATSPGTNEIASHRFAVRASKGAAGISIECDGSSLFADAGLGLQTLNDPWGAWGNHYSEPEAEDISTVLETWQVTDSQVLESGPIRSRLWVRLEDTSSRADLTIDLHHDRPAIDVQMRVFWDRPAARLKIVMPGVGAAAEYEVPGGAAWRGSLKEVPGGRWVRVSGPGGTFGFASDALYNFDLKEDVLRATVVRSSRYAADRPETEMSPHHLPVIDAGEYRCKFLLTPDGHLLSRLARELEVPPIVLPVPRGKGTLPPTGSFAELQNGNLLLLALKPAENGSGWIVRLQELDHQDTTPRFKWLGGWLEIDAIPRSSIATFLIFQEGHNWRTRRVGLDEESLSKRCSPAWPWT